MQFRTAPELLTVNDNPNATYWNIEGYQSNVDADEIYPRRVFGSGMYGTEGLKSQKGHCECRC